MSEKEKCFIAVVGSRTFSDYELCRDSLGWFIYSLRDAQELRDICIVSGGATGADNLAKQYAINEDIQYLEVPARWNEYGKRAGFIRNDEIAKMCEECVAFWDGSSRGTLDTIGKFVRRGKNVTIFSSLAERK